MNCIADQCSQGREVCTRTECGYMPIVLLDKEPANCVERWAVRCFWLVVAGCVGWALYANRHQLQALWSVT